MNFWGEHLCIFLGMSHRLYLNGEIEESER